MVRQAFSFCLVAFHCDKIRGLEDLFVDRPSVFLFIEHKFEYRKIVEAESKQARIGMLADEAGFVFAYLEAKTFQVYKILRGIVVYCGHDLLRIIFFDQDHVFVEMRRQVIAIMPVVSC